MLSEDTKRIFGSVYYVRAILWALMTGPKVLGQFLKEMFLETSILLIQSEEDPEVMGVVVGVVQLQKWKFQR